MISGNRRKCALRRERSCVRSRRMKGKTGGDIAWIPSPRDYIFRAFVICHWSATMRLFMKSMTDRKGWPGECRWACRWDDGRYARAWRWFERVASAGRPQTAREGAAACCRACIGRTPPAGSEPQSKGLCAFSKKRASRETGHGRSSRPADVGRSPQAPGCAPGA